jgi:TonB family protein
MVRRLAGISLCLSVRVASLGQAPTGAAETLHVKRFVAPAYPAVARKSRMQGTTTTQLHVRPNGTVDSVKVLMAHAVFHDYVEAALRQWVFEPSEGSVELKVTISFKLGCDEVHAQRSAETQVEADLPGFVEVRTCSEPVVTSTN